MKLKAAALCAFFIAADTGSLSAQVGFAPYPAEILPRHEVAAIVRSLRLTPIARPVRWGSTYVVRAVDPDGEVVRVIIDAEEGEVLAVRHLYGARFAGRNSRFGPLAPDLDAGRVRAPVPPIGVPRRGLPRGETRSAAIAPTAPLPRPRPDIPVPPAARRPAPASPAAAAPEAAPERMVETTGSIPTRPASGAKPGSEPAASAFPPVAPLE